MIRALQLIISVLAIGVSAQILININSFYPIPITAQSLFVLLIAHHFQWKWGSIFIAAYLLASLLGAPLLSNFKGGWAAFTGPSLGYLLGFLLATLLVGKMAETQEERFAKYLQQFFLGGLVILLAGYVGMLRYFDFKIAFYKAVLPFIPGLFAKTLLGAILLFTYSRFKSFMKAL